MRTSALTRQRGHGPRALRRYLRHQGRLRAGGENLTAAYADIVLGTIFDPYLVDGALDPGRAHREPEPARPEAQITWSVLLRARSPPQILRRYPPAGRAGRYPGELVNRDAPRASRV